LLFTEILLWEIGNNRKYQAKFVIIRYLAI